MKRIAFSGTLDPITNGHMWVIQEARSLADEVVVFISENPFKKAQFAAEKRKEIVEQSVAAQGWDNVRVIMVKGDYTARAAKRYGIDYLVRGIRNTTDFDYENLLQQANVDVLHGAKTIFVMPPRDLGSVSSSFVKGLQGPVGWHWSTKKFMPTPAYAAWIIDWLRKDWNRLWHHDAADRKAQANTERWFNHLTGATAYSAPQRHYHNLDHLVHGLSEIAVWAANTGASDADVQTLKLAFWFHDAVYGGQQSSASNEEQSATLWIDAQLDGADTDGVASLIRATDHAQQHSTSHRHKDVMVGVDLAILGQSQDVYDAYAKAVRAEYAHVDNEQYRTGRMKVLRHFQSSAEHGTLYADSYFADLYQRAALENIGREIAVLELIGS